MFEALPLQSNRDRFLGIVKEEVGLFENTTFIKSLKDRQLTLAQYQNLLCSLFHQVKSSSATFALAAGRCGLKHWEAQNYLFKHAEEEKTHWQWILNDLKNTNYKGPSPADLFPPEPIQAYIALNFYMADVMPVGRLAIASVLEGIGGGYGAKYGGMLLEHLKLQANQAVFFLGHGEADLTHSQEVLDIIDKCDLTAHDWGWMCQAAKTAGNMYRRIYDQL